MQVILIDSTGSEGTGGRSIDGRATVGTGMLGRAHSPYSVGHGTKTDTVGRVGIGGMRETPGSPGIGKVGRAHNDNDSPQSPEIRVDKYGAPALKDVETLAIMEMALVATNGVIVGIAAPIATTSARTVTKSARRVIDRTYG
jgi:hypothetical protein